MIGRCMKGGFAGLTASVLYTVLVNQMKWMTLPLGAGSWFWFLWAGLAAIVWLTARWGAGAARGARSGAALGALTVGLPALLVFAYVTYVAYFMPIQIGITPLRSIGYGALIGVPVMLLGTGAGALTGHANARRFR